MANKIFFIVIYLICIFSFAPRNKHEQQPLASLQKPQDSTAIKATIWVDSVFNSLSADQRLGQLFMVAAYSNKPGKHEQEIENLIKNQNIGGVIFFQGGPVRQAQLTNSYQQLAKTPMLVAMDAEWGLGMRLKDSTISYPKQMTLGAIQNNQQIYMMGKEIARQCKRLGVHINFAPVVDVNSNPNNPIIGMRAFGEDKEMVAAKGIAYMKGMQDNGVIACAKHFPGHGDTDADSHLSLPIIKSPKSKIIEVDLYPFRRLIADSIMSIMVAHIHIPAFDSRPNMATTLSENVVTQLLKEEMKFNGLIFTDALNMKGVSKYYKPGEVDLMALQAGNDVLLYSEDVEKAIKLINKALEAKTLSQEIIDRKVKKILYAKYKVGLHQLVPIEITKLYQDLNSSNAKAVQLESYAQSITLLKNTNKLLPLKYLDTLSVATLSIGLPVGSVFQNTVDLYTNATHFSISREISNAGIDSILVLLKPFNLALVSLHTQNATSGKQFGVTENIRMLLLKIELQQKMVLTAFANPYSLSFFEKTKNLISSYEDNEVMQSIAPQVIFGAREATGKLPITVGSSFPIGTGLNTSNSVWRNRYSYPETVEMDYNTLARIDSIVSKEIGLGAMPGCQVMIAKDGQIVFDKSYGYYTYDMVRPVVSSTIYDIASITKVAGTLQALMFLEERGLVDIDKKISHYLPDLKETNKEHIIFRDVLIHQAGLTPFIPHWKNTLDTSGFMSKYYRRVRSDTFNLEVVPGLYTISTMEDTLWKWTVKSDLQKIKSKKQKRYDYAYSDLGFYITKKIVESIINQPINEFLEQNFYSPLNLRLLTYKPLEKFNALQIAPTENDTLFRKTQLRGNVHDQGAALLGGVAGHAGIFSNARDLLTLCQMNLNQGYYGGSRYLLEGTVQKFAKRQVSFNRRGLGWDKPEYGGGGPTSKYASSETYGHTGYTGTCVWIDPKYNLILVFLSNRGFPNDRNKLLIKHNVRTRIQDLMYQSMLNYKNLYKD